MSQNIYSPSDWSVYTLVETSDGSLVSPFNPDKIAELVNAAMTTLGRPIPTTAYLGAGDNDRAVSVGLLHPVTQQEIDNCMAALLAVCNDPARNNPTDDQADNATVDAKIVSAKANRDAIRGPRDPITNQQTAAGLRDHLNGNTDFGIALGWSDQLLANTAWNALTADDQADILRKVLKGVGGATPQQGVLDILAKMLNYMLDGSQADLTELRLIRDRLINNLP